MKIIVTILITLFLSPSIFCQQPAPSDAAGIVYNGAYIVMHNKADLVIQNGSHDALSVKNRGGIISEDANNNVIWNVANDSGYSVPFVATDLAPVPVSFNTSNASGSGSLTLSTYSGSPNWKNSDYLPPGITNVNKNGKDNSRHLIDRFWKISPAGYTTNPQIKNLLFYYRELEWNEDSNAITEKNLAAQNWNGTKWLARVGNDKPSNNYVKILSVNNIFPWWTLVDSAFALPLQSDVIAQSNDNVFTHKQIANIYLSQNFPNPFSNTTTISYSIQQQFMSAKILITDKNGNALKQVSLYQSNGLINIDGSIFSSGTFQYSLIIDGKIVASKQMENLK